MANWNVYGSAVLIVAGLFLSGCSSASYDEPTIGNPELRQFLEDYRKGPMPELADIPDTLQNKYFPSVKPPLTNTYATAFIIFLAKKLDSDLTRSNVVATIKSLDGYCTVSLGINPSLDRCRVKVWDYELVPSGPSMQSERRISSSINISTELIVEYTGAADTDTIKKITVLDELVNIFDGLEKYEGRCTIWSR